jgi:ABC-type uncharacterized transport system ATPase subunit
MMIGQQTLARHRTRAGPPARRAEIEGVRTRDRSGLKEIAIDALTVRAGEIVGIAGISGNGQMELMEILTGQRPLETGTIRGQGPALPRDPRRGADRCVRYLPEEPLRNACAPRMSVAENIAFRSFDLNGKGTRFWLSGREMRRRAADLVGVQGQDRLARRADRLAVGRQRAARRAGARTDRRGRPADRLEPLLRPRLLGRGRNPGADHGRAQRAARRCC